jgi:hypothetical protein
MKPHDIFKAFGIISGNYIDSYMKSYVSPIDKGIIGHGIILKPLDIKNNRDKYSQLYRNDIKLNENIFRLGGMSSGFNNKSYCNLIYYGVDRTSLIDATTIGHSGNHCIIDINGDIKFMSPDTYESVYYHQGVICSMKNVYYNLLNGKRIIEGSQSIKSKDFLFVEHAYDWYNKDMPLGVYKINWNTGEIEYFK